MEIDLGTIPIRGREIIIKGLIHRRAKRLKLSLDHRQQRIRLTIPKKVSLQAARQFVLDSEKWLNSRLREDIKPIPFVDGQIIPILGRRFQIRHHEHKLSHVWFHEDTLWVQGEKAALHKLIVGFLKNQSKIYFLEKSRHYAVETGVHFQKVMVKEIYSRWGSCSASGVLSYSWRLIFAPLEVITYVIVHEVCHLKNMDHSATFWAHVASLCADFRQHRAWFKVHGKSLFLYGESDELTPLKNKF